MKRARGSSFRDAELLEPSRKLGAVGTGVDVGHHVEDGAFGVNDEGPPLGICPVLVNHSVCGGDLLVWIAQYGIVETERLGESPVGIG